MKIGIIPPSSDQVLVGDMERTRLKDIKVLFFVGVNDGKIPREDAAGKILSDLNLSLIHILLAVGIVRYIGKKLQQKYV